MALWNLDSRFHWALLLSISDTDTIRESIIIQQLPVRGPIRNTPPGLSWEINRSFNKKPPSHLMIWKWKEISHRQRSCYKVLVRVRLLSQRHDFCNKSADLKFKWDVQVGKFVSFVQFSENSQLFHRLDVHTTRRSNSVHPGFLQKYGLSMLKPPKNVKKLKDSQSEKNSARSGFVAQTCVHKPGSEAKI